MNRYQELVKALSRTTFYEDPASAKFHGNYPGGLSDHSDNVEKNLYHLTKKLLLKWQDKESFLIIPLAHDVCKIGLYIPDGKGGYTYNKDQPPGHGDLSVKMVKEWIELTPEEEACIRYHMGAFVEGSVLGEGEEAIQREWNAYNEAIHEFPNVLWTHVADMMASHIDEIRKVS